MALNHRIALLGTGDEIINGDILNTNCQYIAHQLFLNRLLPGRQVVASDDQAEIEEALHYLLKDHLAVITIGGLGPTSDDRTRFAIAKALNKELIFDEKSWQHIVHRLTSLGYQVPESNRQQCLFPEGATILPNEQGTAAGCYLSYQKKHIFMLPGPPREIMPMVDSVVIPQFIRSGLQTTTHRRTWLLMGIGEGNLAEKVDALAEGSHCQVGYRANFPYLELKISAEKINDLSQLLQKIEPIFTPYLISEKLKSASDQLYDYLKQYSKKIFMEDNATCGALQSRLCSPKTWHALSFKDKNADDLHIQIKGLEDYWMKNTDARNTTLSITFQNKNQKKNIIKKELLLRGKYTVILAVEICCWEILQYLLKIETYR